jgi:hypothetical protein
MNGHPCASSRCRRRSASARNSSSVMSGGGPRNVATTCPQSRQVYVRVPSLAAVMAWWRCKQGERVMLPPMNRSCAGATLRGQLEGSTLRQVLLRGAAMLAHAASPSRRSVGYATRDGASDRRLRARPARARCVRCSRSCQAASRAARLLDPPWRHTPNPARCLSRAS